MRGKNKDVLVLIPVYKVNLSDSEKKSLERTLSVLADYPIAIIKPESLEIQLSSLISCYSENAKVGMISFDDKYFESVKHYNRLLLGKEFYQRFLDYRYILICQLDVFLFTDNLAYWVSKNYDYIGSPWPIEEEKKFLKAARKSTISWWYFITYLVNRWFFNKKDYAIGNGGLSLRKVKKSLFIVKTFSMVIKKYKLNEDIFWSISAPLLNPFFRVPNLKDALAFSFEKSPAYYYKMNDEQLPFGCHAWEKYDPGFWKKIAVIKEFLLFAAMNTF